MLERTIPRMVEIKVNLAENLHSVNGDAVQFNQLLMNLLVDDEASLRDLGPDVLSRYGYTVLPASSGEEALEIYGQAEVIDLVILDVSMPGMGGRKCLSELLKINPKAKIVISSGYSLDGSLQDILSSGASGFVSKPFSINKLLISIRQVLDQ